MFRQNRRPLFCALVPFCLFWASCSDDADQSAKSAKTASANQVATQKQDDVKAEAARVAMLDKEWPLHGLVTGLQLVVHKEPDADSLPYGWLRIGSRIRLKPDPTKAPNCNTGWYRVFPHGWACAGQGIEVGESPPKGEFEVPPPERDKALPYDYWFVKELMVPEYHRPPSRDEQRAALAFAKRYLEILEKNEKRAAKFLNGELSNEPKKPNVVHRYLDRGFFVASVGVEVRAFRRFVRTVRGRYIKQAQLEQRTGSEFKGVELGKDRKLPVVWAVRTSAPMIRRDKADGSVKWVKDAELEPIERHTIVENWKGRENIDGTIVHILENKGQTRYVKDWFFSVVEKIERPKEVGADEPWVHVDISNQSLVLYKGDTPTYTTLVSSGLAEHDTPQGLYTVRRKYIADTMANLGSSMDDRYSIEDVPWTQYFEGSFALHAAFWHSRFGLQKSHGCVNLAPKDAHHVFDSLWPVVPDGWLGVVTDLSPFPASHVLVTE